MRNITVAIDDEVYMRARVWCAEHDTSVSAIVQYMLSTLRTDWRANSFVAARQRNPDIKRPIAPFAPAYKPAPPAPSESSFNSSSPSPAEKNEKAPE